MASYPFASNSQGCNPSGVALDDSRRPIALDHFDGTATQQPTIRSSATNLESLVDENDDPSFSVLASF
jgi:hypothetical protein